MKLNSNIDDTIDLTLMSVFNTDINKKWRPAYQYKTNLIKENTLLTVKKSTYEILDGFFDSKFFPGIGRCKIKFSLRNSTNTSRKEIFYRDCNDTYKKLFYPTNKLESEYERQEWDYYERTSEENGVFIENNYNGFYNAIFKRNHVFRKSNFYTKINPIKESIFKYLIYETTSGVMTENESSSKSFNFYYKEQVLTDRDLIRSILIQN